MVIKKNMIIAIIVAGIVIIALFTYVIMTRPSLSIAQQKVVTASEIMPGPGGNFYQNSRDSDNSDYDNESDNAYVYIRNQSVEVFIFFYIFISDSDCQIVTDRNSQMDLENRIQIPLGDAGYVWDFGWGCFGLFAINNTYFEINERTYPGSDYRGQWITSEVLRIASTQLSRLD